MKEYKCLVCGFVYSEESGHPESGLQKGTKWEEVPSSWVCPLCGAPKEEFALVGEEKENKKPVKIEFEKDETLKSAELSVIFSNIAKGFEKQYKMEEAGYAKELSDYYEKRISTSEKSLSDIISLINEELKNKYPMAVSISSDNKDRGALRALAWGEKVTRMLKSILTRYEKEGESMLEGVGIHVCDICGYIYIGNEVPDICPVCKVPKFKILKV